MSVHSIPFDVTMLNDIQFIMVKSKGKCRYFLYHLKFTKIRTFDEYCEEIFEKHFYQTFVCMKSDGELFVLSRILY
jgi:hypothetical protein